MLMEYSYHNKIMFCQENYITITGLCYIMLPEIYEINKIITLHLKLSITNNYVFAEAKAKWIFSCSCCGWH